MRRRTSKFLVVAVVMALSSAARADGSLDALFNSSRNTAAPGQSQQGAQPASTTQAQAGLAPDAPPSQPPSAILWTTKADFLTAARNGDLIGLGNASDDDLSKVVNSIAAILRSDYGVDMFFLDPAKNIYENRPLPMCAEHFRDVVKRVVSDVTTMRATLSDNPPDFYKAPGDNAQRVDYDVKALQSRDGNYCDLYVLGTAKPNPYQAALLQLMGEYGQASKDYVDGERSKRQQAYAAEQKAKADGLAKQEAHARAAEQAAIDAKNAKLKAEQAKQLQQDSNRVGF